MNFRPISLHKSETGYDLKNTAAAQIEKFKSNFNTISKHIGISHTSLSAPLSLAYLEELVTVKLDSVAQTELVKTFEILRKAFAVKESWYHLPLGSMLVERNVISDACRTICRELFSDFHELDVLDQTAVLYLTQASVFREPELRTPSMSWLILEDGKEISVQAGRYMYSSPAIHPAEMGERKYFDVEVGTRFALPDIFIEFAADGTAAYEKGTHLRIYAHVPMNLLLMYIASCGGIDRQSLQDRHRYWGL